MLVVILKDFFPALLAIVPIAIGISEQAGFLKERTGGAKPSSLSRAIFLLKIEKQFPYF